ncbi:MAG: hydrogenase maturation nickel metallochaperone HypA [Armatimonadota bacterium]|jgi:hydrogenase nickel incorporation protein HypA/HybF
MHHELSIAKNILDGVLKEARRADVRRVVGVKLNLGALKGISPDALQLHFRCVAEGTPAEGATLDVNHIAAAARCTDCGDEFPIEHMLAACPKCESPRIEVTSGLELSVDALDVECA